MCKPTRIAHQTWLIGAGHCKVHGQGALIVKFTMRFRAAFEVMLPVYFSSALCLACLHDAQVSLVSCERKSHHLRRKLMMSQALTIIHDSTFIDGLAHAHKGALRITPKTRAKLFRIIEESASHSEAPSRHLAKHTVG